MKKTLFITLILVILCNASLAIAQSNVRVQCRAFTMNVPSDNVHCYQIEENIPVSDGAQPEELAKAQIASTSIYFSDFENYNSLISPQVTFYLIDDLSKTSFSLLDSVLSLSDIINNLRAGDMSVDAITVPVPFLPFQSDEQKAAILPKMIDFGMGSGIRTVVSFQDPISANRSSTNLYYSWQGLSDNGRYYISAVFPLTNTELDGKPADEINRETINSSGFQPSLEQLDYYIRSIVIE